jgi:membrane-bound lytic murein transglycosylase A
LWLEAEETGSGLAPVRRLVVAQDTGGAIRGAVRGDLFLGAGAEAEAQAGRMKMRGRYYLIKPVTGRRVAHGSGQ